MTASAVSVWCYTFRCTILTESPHISASDTAVRPRRGIIGNDIGVDVDLLSEVERGLLENVRTLVREEGLGDGLGEFLLVHEHHREGGLDPEVHLKDQLDPHLVTMIGPAMPGHLTCPCALSPLPSFRVQTT